MAGVFCPGIIELLRHVMSRDGWLLTRLVGDVGRPGKGKESKGGGSHSEGP